MKLRHKALRFIISASVVVLTSSFLVYDLVTSEKSIQTYMRYLGEKADSSFLYDKYQNQSIAVHLMRAFTRPNTPVGDAQRQAFCRAFTEINNTHGVNLISLNYPPLHGTLQTAATNCADIIDDAMLLPAFDEAVMVNRNQREYSEASETTGQKVSYYLDLQNRYVYFYDRIDSREFTMRHWSFLQKGAFGINNNDFEGLFSGRTVLSSIYQDNLTDKKIMTFLTPVYLYGKLKGMVMIDINQNNLKNIFYTVERPRLWPYLEVTLSDLDSGKSIIIQESKYNLFTFMHYHYDIPGGMRVTFSLNTFFFIVLSWKTFAFYLLATALLLHMVRLHFRIYHNVTRENISDAMTGLYNRKILTSQLEQRLQRLVRSGTRVAFYAVDLDKLKQINDTQGHHEGDRAIILLAQAIEASIRKSDYAIRFGGDEFCVIMVDSPPEVTATLSERIARQLQLLAPEKEIAFSSGVYHMKADDTIQDAYKASDEQLYFNKRQKLRHS
ncbi:TPA: diguanylate cyclase DgcJ [Citrobacter freundii]